MRHTPSTVLIAALVGAVVPSGERPPSLHATVDLEEVVYSFSPAGNGAGPLWDFGNSEIARAGEVLFATGIQTQQGAARPNNVKCQLWERTSGSGWKLIEDPLGGPTREPCPLAYLPRIRTLLVSLNDAIPSSRPYQATVSPSLWAMDLGQVPPRKMSVEPRWMNGSTPRFNEYSYRAFAVDPQADTVLLTQNVGFESAEWSYFRSDGTPLGQGKLPWPPAAGGQGKTRVSYLHVLVHHPEVHIVGLSDVPEDNALWHEYKAKAQADGARSDYAFRRLYYTHTGDIVNAPFRQWTELTNVEATGGVVTPGDISVSKNGNVLVLWTEQLVDPRLRTEFFAHTPQRTGIKIAVLRGSQVVSRHTLREVTGDDTLSIARFLIAPNDRVFVMYAEHHGGSLAVVNRIVEIDRNGKPLRSTVLPVSRPFWRFMTATPRTGTPPSSIGDILGTSFDAPNTVRYARVNVN